MCAIMVMGIGIVGLTVGITTSLASSKESERQTVAALMAAGHIETLRADGYLVEGEETGTGEGALSAYQWRHSIVNTATDGLFQLRVIVEFTPTGQVVYQLETLLFDPPVYSTLDDADEQKKRDPTLN